MKKAKGNWKEYEDMGKKWIAGEFEVESFQDITLTKHQKEFVNSKERYVLGCGGMASGKTTSFIIKLILVSLWFPNNLILLGRKTRMDVERTTLRDFFDICPPELYHHKVGQGIIEFGNGSQILMFGLDALQSGSGQDIKKAIQQIKSLNLGGVFIDQIEEIEYPTFEALRGRLRRDIGFNQMSFTMNPANHWTYDYFKKEPEPNTHLIMSSMLDNKNNLPEEFVDDRLSMKGAVRDRHVLGIWEFHSETAVFPKDYMLDQKMYVRRPVRQINGISIFHNPLEHDYQLGIDPSEGSVDPCSMTMVDLDTGDVVATYSDYISLDKQADIAVQMCRMYSKYAKPLIIPETNGPGLALVQILKRKYRKIYERTTKLSRYDTPTKKLGFNTNYQSKTELIENIKTLLSYSWVKFRDLDILEEFEKYEYNNTVRKSGAGAPSGFHDDRVMSTMLAFWSAAPRTKRESDIFKRLNRQENKRVVKYAYE